MPTPPPGFVHILGLHLSTVVVHWCCPEQRQEPAYLNPPNPLFKGAHQGLRAFHRCMAALPANSGPASEDALLLLLDNGRTAVLPVANCEAPTDNQTYAEFKYITCIYMYLMDVLRYQ